eukprot:5787333-Amphidinium_carterae.1
MLVALTARGLCKCCETRAHMGDIVNEHKRCDDSEHLSCDVLDRFRSRLRLAELGLQGVLALLHAFALEL